MGEKYEVKISEKLGRYLVAAKDLKAGEIILSEKPFVLGPSSSLVCFNCYLPLINKFFVCKNCAVAPICSGDGCSPSLSKWHNELECDFFRNLKLSKGISPMVMVENVASLLVVRVILKRDIDKTSWKEFTELETHLSERKDTSVWQNCENTAKFIQSLGLLDGIDDDDFVQKICAAIDVNSFEVRGPAVPVFGWSELLRGVYLKAALMAHDCVANTHMAINDNNVLICHSSTNIKKGEVICHNYTDSLKGTAVRQQHLLFGKYFKCTCNRCEDLTEMGTYMSSALCPACETGFVSQTSDKAWTCHSCDYEHENSVIHYKVECCAKKFTTINKTDLMELEEYIKNVSLVLAPNHYLLLDAKQHLAGVLRDTISRETRPSKKIMRRKLILCNELLHVLEKICPGICRIKAITLYELHTTIVQLAKKLFHSKEINITDYLNELQRAEKCLKESLEMLLVEPGNSPEGELCAKALEEYRALKALTSRVLFETHGDNKTSIKN